MTTNPQDDLEQPHQGVFVDSVTSDGTSPMTDKDEVPTPKMDKSIADGIVGRAEHLLAPHPIPTPLTDAHEATCGDYEKPYKYARRTAKFARQLERALAKKTAEVEALKAWQDEALKKLESLHKENAQLKQEAEQWRDALDDCASGLFYIRKMYGELRGVGFIRALDKAYAMLNESPTPKAE